MKKTIVVDIPEGATKFEIDISIRFIANEEKFTRTIDDWYKLKEFQNLKEMIRRMSGLSFPSEIFESVAYSSLFNVSSDQERNRLNRALNCLSKSKISMFEVYTALETGIFPEKLKIQKFGEKSQEIAKELFGIE